MGRVLALYEDLIPNTFVAKPGVCYVLVILLLEMGSGGLLGPMAGQFRLTGEHQAIEGPCHRKGKGGRTPEEWHLRLSSAYLCVPAHP